jgi:hypothetical protein
LHIHSLKLKKKALRIQKYCQSKGYEYLTRDLRRKKRNFFFITTNHMDRIREIKNMKFFRGKMQYSFKMKLNNFSTIISEMQYRSGSGKHSSTYNYIIALVETENQRPSFSISIQNRFMVFFKKDITFPNSPEFQDKYSIIGEDTEAIKEYFNETRIQQFLQKSTLDIFRINSFEIKENYILYSKQSSFNDDKTIDEFIKEVEKNIGIFEN